MPQLPTGVISEFAHPPWGVLEREVIGTFDSTTNPNVLTRPRGPIDVDAFGFAWSVFSAPLSAGRQTRLVTTYEDPFMQLGVLYTDIAAHQFYAPLLDVHQDGVYLLFEQPIPTSVNIWVFPNFSVTMFWLVAL